MTACFNELPLEVKTMVWSYIDYDYSSDLNIRDPVSLTPYACVSREWQLGYERMIFRQIFVCSSRVSCFHEYVNTRRMALLRTLGFRIATPEPCPKDPIERIRWNNAAFIKGVRDLWALLKFIKDSWPNRQALKLRVYVSGQRSYMHCQFPDELLDLVDDVKSDDFRSKELEQPNETAELSNRLQSKSMRVTEDLPVIPWVNELTWSGPIHGGASMKIASRFNGLTYFKASLHDDCDYSRQFRLDLAWKMSHLSLPRLSELVLKFNVLLPREAHSVSNIIWQSSDAFSVAVHRLSQSPNLVKVHIGNHDRRFSVTPELFWPQLEEVGDWQKPFWPCLQSISVDISSISPDGTSLHIEEHRDNEIESARFNMDKVNPLFMAAARAAQQMPVLLEMNVRIEPDEEMDNLLCEMAFAAQNYCSERDVKGDHAALRLDGFILAGSTTRVLHSSQLDLSKPRVSIVMPSRSPIDSQLAQVWKASKGENIDYKICYGYVLKKCDDDDSVNDGDIHRLIPHYELDYSTGSD